VGYDWYVGYDGYDRYDGYDGYDRYDGYAGYHTTGPRARVARLFSEEKKLANVSAFVVPVVPSYLSYPSYLADVLLDDRDRKARRALVAGGVGRRAGDRGRADREGRAGRGRAGDGTRAVDEVDGGDDELHGGGLA